MAAPVAAAGRSRPARAAFALARTAGYRHRALRIAANDELAVRLTKRAIHRSVEITGLRDALDQALQLDLEIETANCGKAP